MSKYVNVLLFMLFSFYLAVEASQKYTRPQEFCSSLDITKLPRIAGEELNGLWFSQRIFRPFPSTTFTDDGYIFWQFQGQKYWFPILDNKTGKCKSFAFTSKQRQTVENGPFSPCYSVRQALPVDGSATETEFVFLPLSKNLVIVYTCLQSTPGKRCKAPLVRVNTKTLKITKDDLSLIKQYLPRFGVSPNRLKVLQPEKFREIRKDGDDVIFLHPGSCQSVSRSKYQKTQIKEKLFQKILTIEKLKTRK